MTQETFDNQSQIDSTPADTSTPTTSERTFTQAEVNKIVGGVRAKVRNEYSGQQNVESERAHQPYVPVGATPEQIRQIAAEEAKKSHQEILSTMQQAELRKQGEAIASQYIAKIEAGKTNYKDFDEKVNDFISSFDGGYGNPMMARIVDLANEVDNSADVMYELANNPAKAANLLTMSGMNQNLARKEIHKLAQSMKINAAAKNIKTPNEPLSQIKSSPVGMDNGSMTVSDLRKHYLKSRR